MKKIFSSIVLTLAMVSSFMACQEYRIDSQPEAPLALQVDAQDSYTLLATSPSRIVFNVSANTPWTIESDQQWCVPSPAMSAASALVSEIIVTTEDNPDRSPRTATLTVSAEGVAEKVVITIVQASKENLVVVPYDGTVSADGGTFSFTIVSNKPWEIIPSTAFISNIDKKSGEGVEGSVEETVTVTVPANTGATRRGTLTVQTEFDTYSFEVVQSGFLLELTDVPSTNIISLDGGGLATEFTTGVNSNLDWKVVIPADYEEWLSVERDGNNLKIKVTQNNRLSVRNGYFTLTTVEPIAGFEGVKVEVLQPIAFNIKVADTIVDESTGNVKLPFAKSILTSDFKFTKGRLVVEFDEIKAQITDEFGFKFYGDNADLGARNFHFFIYSENKYKFRIGGSTSSDNDWWRSNIEKSLSEYLQLSDIKKVEFSCLDDPNNQGKLEICLYVNDSLYGKFSNLYNIFADGDPKIYFHMQCQKEPAIDSYCIVKSITYTPAE